MKYHHFLLIFILVVFTTMAFNTKAFTSFDTHREVSLETSNDRFGLISLDPYGENGIYFTDVGNDGRYEFYIEEIPLQVNTYDNIMTITNNLNNPVEIKIIDNGEYEDRVSFTSDAYDLELDGRMISVGNNIYVDLTIDATGLEEVSLLDSINIIAYQNEEEIYNMYRPVVLTTAEGDVYDPYSNDMPTNAEYLGQIAYEILNAGGTISEGSDCFEDMGLDPEVWNNNINGYEYSYYEEYDGVIFVNNTADRIWMGWYGLPIKVNKNTGIMYSIFNDYYLVRWRKLWLTNAYPLSYY